MELGMEFDDSFFGEEKVRNLDSSATVYKAKVYSPEWFDSDSVLRDGDTAEPQNVYKFRAELLYRKELYEDSLRHYSNCLGELSAKNSVTWRDVIEGMCRCCLALGKNGRAMDLAQQLHVSSVTFEQKTASWMLLAKVYRHLGNLQEERQMLQVLLMMHSLNADFWLRLGVIHSRLSGRQSSEEPNRERRVADNAVNTVTYDMSGGDKRSDGHDDTRCEGSHERTVVTEAASSFQHLQFACVCLQRARFLLCSIQKTVVSFDKSHNATQQQKIDKKIQELCLPEELVQRHAEVTEKEVFRRKDRLGGDSEVENPDTNTLVKLTREDVSKMFDKKWFFWIIDGDNNE